MIGRSGEGADDGAQVLGSLLQPHPVHFHDHVSGEKSCRLSGKSREDLLNQNEVSGRDARAEGQHEEQESDQNVGENAC